MTYFLLIFGFIILIKSADWLVTGASSLAHRLGVSALVIGLTIVAFGTSAPELVVNLLASLNGNTDIAIGNIIGSNIANILLILGVSAIIFPLTVQRGTVWKEIPFALLAALVVAIMANDMYFDDAATSVLTRIDGIILLFFFAIFLYYIFEISRESSTSEHPDSPLIYSYTKSITLVVVGMIGLVIGGRWIVENAVTIATNLGLSETLIGVTVLAIGTSLPELATSVAAAFKKQVDIAVGNIIGSNIFNIFWILGISATVTPLPFASTLITDMLLVIVATLLLFFSLFVGKKHTIERWQGYLFVLIFIGYMIFVVLRG